MEKAVAQMSLDALQIGSDFSLRDAMEVIDRGSVEIALVVDEKRRLEGTLSDGDIRRAILAGAGLGDKVKPYFNPAPRIVSPDVSRAEVLDLMGACFLAQVPVVDDKGRVVGLHLLRELLGAVERRNTAVIMVGGKGARLAPLTDTIPKPMLRVAGRPILERLILHLVGSGIRRVFLAVNYFASVIEDYFGDGAQWGCSIKYLREAPALPLGTAGALSLLAPDTMSDHVPLLVLNGDLVTNFSVDELLSNHEKSGCLTTVAVREFQYEVPYGVAEVDGQRLTALAEKPVMSWIINAGIYVLQPAIVRRVPANSSFAITDLIGGCLGRGEPVNIWYSGGDWDDVGRIGDLRRAQGYE